MPFVPTQGSLVAPAFTSGLEASVAADGDVHLRRDRAVDVGMRLVRAGRHDELASAPSALRQDEGRAVLERGAVREWYVSAARGVEQGFDLLTKPVGGGLVVLALATSGARPELRGEDVVFVDARGAEVLGYSALAVFDALGRELPSSMRVTGTDVELAFDDRDAVYPVRVDPFATNPVGTLSAPSIEAAASELCGTAVVIRGDLAVVGCPLAPGPMTEVAAGAAYLFRRSASNIWTFQQRLVPNPVVAGAQFGKSIAIDGNIVVGAPQQDAMSTASAGAVYVFDGSGGSGFNQSHAIVPPDPSASLAFGTSVAIEGALVVVGAPGGGIVGGPTGSGSVYLVDISSTLPTFGPEFAAPTPVAGDAFGASVAISSSHVIVGAPGTDDASNGMNAGAAYVFTVGASAPSLAATLLAVSPNANAAFGYDVDIDLPIAVVGSPRANTARGTSTGAVGVYEFTSSWGRADWIVPADVLAGEFLGTSVAVDNDVILAGAPGYLNGPATTKIGGTYLYVDEGSAWILGSKIRPTDAVAGDAVGFDVDLDRANDELILGMPLDQLANFAQQGSGRVFGIPELAFLRVGLHGAGSGSVMSVPDAIACGTDCVEVFATAGTSMQLTATPAAGSYLASVTGVCTTAICSLNVTSDGRADYTFELKKANGAMCTAGVQCTSNNCVDGVCCNDGCGGNVADCQACSVAAGAAVDGTCGPLVSSLAATRVCRASLGGCDPAEVCIPTSTTCPQDARSGAGVVCRAAVDPLCDTAEMCTGGSVDCPTDVRAAATTLCDNGIACDGISRCNAAGQCVAGPVPTCLSDDNPCTVDICVDPVGCINAMQPGCMVVDGGAVFADAGIVDAGDVDAGQTTPPPPTFRGQGGCGCELAGAPGGAPAWLAPIAAVGLLALAWARRSARVARARTRK